MRSFLLLYPLMILATGGCTAKQGYFTLHDWQRQQCKKVVDSTEREQCLTSASRTYDEYIKSEEYKKSNGGKS